MKKKWIILLSSIAIIFIACQAEDSVQPKDTEKAFKESESEQMEDSISLPDDGLQKRDKSNEVSALQQALSYLGYSIEETGIYNDITTWAITDSQLQKDVMVSGLYDTDTKEAREKLLQEDGKITAGSQLEKPASPDQYPEIVENPYDVLALVNKNHALPSDYVPEDLVVPDIRFPFEEDVPKKQLREIAAKAIEELFTAAESDGIHLFAQSGYRSYDRQEAIFASNVAKNGEDHANTYSARAGESEHQTGLVMDVTSQNVGFELVTDFGNTEEGIWLKEHAHEFGFIIRYPKGKEDITKYQYEPWHLRFIGEKAATEIYENDGTLEEYFGVAS